MQNEKKTKKDTSLVKNYPEIAKEWHTEKNNGVDVNDVMYGSNKSFWWRCKCGCEYDGMVVVGIIICLMIAPLKRIKSHQIKIHIMEPNIESFMTTLCNVKHKSKKLVTI